MDQIENKSEDLIIEDVAELSANQNSIKDNEELSEKRAEALRFVYFNQNQLKNIDYINKIVCAPCHNNIEMAKRLCAFISIYLAERPTESQVENNRTVEDIILSGHASCADRELIFSSCLLNLGIKVRRVGFLDVPFQGAHTASEAFIDGQWCFFDVTTGFYFADINQSEPISLAAARKLYPDVNVFRIKSQAMGGPQGDHIDVSWLPSNLAPAYDKYGDIYCLPRETYFLCSVTGAEVSAYDDYDIAINLEDKDEWSFGAPFEPGSISAPVKISGLPKLVPMIERLGKFDHGCVRHNLYLLSGDHKRIQLTVVMREDQDVAMVDLGIKHYVTPELIDPPFGEAKFATKYFGNSGNVAVFDVHVLPPMTKLSITVPWQYEYEVKYIGIKAYPGGRRFKNNIRID